MSGISFDDLIPQNGAGQGAGQDISFDDLIPQGSGVALNTTAGLNSAIYSTLGAPVDLARGAINLGSRGINAVAGTDIPLIPSDSFGGSESISRGFGAIGVPEPKDIVAATPEERIARGVGEGVGYAVAPEAAVSGLARAGASRLAPAAAEMARNLFGRGESIGAVAGNMVAGGAGGAGATAAMEAAPDQWKPLAGVAGGMGGGFAGALAATAPQMARAGGRALSDFTAPLTAAGRERLAADQILGDATDPYAVKSVLAELPEDLVPGSKPTTFQVTGDMGMGALERAAQTRRPELFNQRRADQNSARTAALDGVQPTGAPEKVAETARGFMQAIQSRADEAYEAAATAARSRAEEIGQGSTPELAGENLRSSLEEARAAAKTVERQLWAAVDPDGSLALPVANAKQRMQANILGTPRTAKPIGGEESAIYGALGELPDVAPFSDMTALQSRVKAELRAERLANGESPAYRRLTQLNGALETDIADAVAGKMQQEAQAVARGEMANEDTIAAAILRQQREWYDGRAEAKGVGQSLGEGSGAYASFRASGISSASRGAEPSGGEFRDPSGNPSLQEAGLVPNFDADAAERLKAARAATLDRANTFDNQTLGPMRRRPSTASPYDMAASAIPARIFNSKAESPAAIAQLRAAVGDEAALSQIEDYAVGQIRRQALREDGTLDPVKLDSWRRTHAHALDAVPGLDRRLADAQTASSTMAEVARTQRQAVEEAQRGRVGALMGLSDPGDVTRVIGGIFQRQDRVNEMGKLARVVGADPEAAQGLRKAVVDHVMSRFVANTEAGTSGQGAIKSDQFQTFVRQNGEALRAAGFSDDELGLMGRVAEDLQRANRSNTAVKLPNASNTAQDVTKIQEGDQPATVLGRILLAVGAGGGLMSSGMTGGVAGALGAKAVTTLRSFGLETVNDIVADALLNPERARILLQKATPQSADAVGAAFARTFTRGAAAGTLSQEDEREGSAVRRVADALAMRQPADSTANRVRSKVVEALSARQEGRNAIPSPAAQSVANAMMMRQQR